MILNVAPMGALPPNPRDIFGQMKEDRVHV